LVTLVEQASEQQLLSYIPAVPFIAFGLAYARRGSFPQTGERSLGLAILLGSASAAAISAAISGYGRLSVNNGLALTTLAYVCLVLAGGFLFVGKKWMAAAAFPAAFLFFLAPPPDALMHAIESVSVLGSSAVSGWLFHLTGTPFVREGTVFVLPGITLEIARECSGINSSWTLLIVGLIASNLFLKTMRTRAVLLAFVAPLAIFRNSVRIVTIGLLCVHVGPDMINSYIHRSGGPFFFALSLVPLLLMVVWLRRVER
jgi:exosortase